MGITFSDKSSSDEDMNISDKQPKDEAIFSKSRFSVTTVAENTTSTLKLIKVPPEFVKPKLTINAGASIFFKILYIVN